MDMLLKSNKQSIRESNRFFRKVFNYMRQRERENLKNSNYLSCINKRIFCSYCPFIHNFIKCLFWLLSKLSQKVKFKKNTSLDTYKKQCNKSVLLLVVFAVHASCQKQSIYSTNFNKHTSVHTQYIHLHV